MTCFTTKTGELVPCGKCADCRARRASGWSFRLIEEDRHCSSAYFLTLTYDPAKVHLSPRGFMTLDSQYPLNHDTETRSSENHHPGQTKRDVQLFFKRLRKANMPRILKYYLVGEYGGVTKRPHYHCILFNASIETIQAAWPHGQIHYGSVTGASVGYTLKYMSKPKTVPAHQNDDRLPEFSLMSKGLGKSYLDSDQMVTWHKNDLTERMYLNIEDGKKISMPRYYKDKLYSAAEREIVATAAQLRASLSLGETPTEHQAWLDRKAGIKHSYEQQFSNKNQKTKI